MCSKTKERKQEPYPLLQLLASVEVGQYIPAGQKMVLLVVTSAQISAPPH
jgi:hypothetical protein